MNHIDIQQAGGFPMETNTLDAMQKSYEVFNVFGGTIASLAIVSGCVITGNQVSNGYVNIDNILYEFRGGQASQYVIIQQEEESRNFESGETKIVYIKRWATFGESSSPENNYPWADFHRSITNKELSKRANHVGFIQDYYGPLDNIPTGWFLCDGSNGTPDLRGRFVVGYKGNDADYNELGKVGGAKEVALTANQNGRHTHGGSVSIPDHTHTYLKAIKARGYRTQADDNPFGNHESAQTSSAGGGTFTVSVGESGAGEAHENRPPYYVLAKIMYKG
ncbi:hypothetical protein [Faecalibacter macacae]|uniref:Phage tail collar domain-containing protein n=1 Tax=Faecalibacter macacae TaxID=1859289 RepID=A0A3L9M628_9FLAO|nr:hypothetical protein [Faecalibacter macacae]RLZ08610.1 hypothetical protein EAH69_09865 [Faecalibacter macacae]